VRVVSVRSYSQLTTFGQCAREYQLARVVKLPRRPAWYFIGGNAVHSVIESYLKQEISCASASAATVTVPSNLTGTANSSTPTASLTDASPASAATTTRSPSSFDAQAEFLSQLDAEYARELAESSFTEDEWAAGYNGRQRLDWWTEHGPQYVQNFINWWQVQDADVWLTPRRGVLPRKAAIELPLEVEYGNVTVKMVIDLVIRYRVTGLLRVIDYKSGSTKPKTSKQLGIYLDGIEQTYGVRPDDGAYFMVRGGKNGDEFLLPPVPLNGPQYSHAYLTQQFAQLEAGITAGAFVPNAGDGCRTRGMSYACTEVGGVEAYMSDPNHPDYCDMPTYGG
jgi:hypothetical protein